MEDAMADIEQIVKATVGEIERFLNTKRVVGDPVIAGENTIIPLVSVGFGFGAGLGSGKGKEADKREGGGEGGGTGGGGGIKPVAVIVINKDGVRVEPVKRGATPVLEKVVETIGKAAQKRGGESSE
jgi:uncharacterized spore protein YtfJ